jgi:hypothetical protein
MLRSGLQEVERRRKRRWLFVVEPDHPYAQKQLLVFENKV